MKETVFLIHGYTASPEANWFPWLQQMLNKQDQKITLLPMPDANHPHPDAWDAMCEKSIAGNDGITLIGHSLGCIQTLRFLQKSNIRNVNLILVSGFDEPLLTLPQLDAFTREPVNYANILPKINQAVVISAIDDDIVPYLYSETLARHLKCKFILMPAGKHFISRDGTYTLPVVYQELLAMMEMDG